MTASRSSIVHVGIRAASPLAITVGVYLFFAGHNQPGGGFAAGLVLGAVITLRTVTGLQRPTNATGLLSSGIVIVTATAAAPLIWGGTFFDQRVVSVELPVLGTVKSGSALIFDAGVTIIVIGLVIALLDGLSTSEPSAIETDAEGRP